MPRKQTRKTIAKFLGVRGPRSAYILFVNERREAKKAEHSDASNTQLVSLLAEDWKQLTDAQKKPFVKQAVKDRKRYEKELEKARRENPEKVEEFGKIRHKKVKREQYGVRGARSAYILFSTQQRPQLVQEFPNEPMVEITKRIGAQWRELDDAGRAPFVKRAQKDRKRYVREYTAAKEAALAATATATTDEAVNENVTDENQVLTIGNLDGDTIKLSFGKKKHHLIKAI